MDRARRTRAMVALVSSLHFAQHVFRILPALLPLLVLEFPYPLWKLGALVSVYFAGSGFGQAPMGVLLDRYDRRFVLPPSVALMGAGYLWFGLVPGFVDPRGVAITLAGEPFTSQFLLLALGVFVAGLGASVVHPAGLSLVAVNAPVGRSGRILGAWSAGSKLGDAVAPTAVALLVLALAWHEIFLVFGALGVGYAAALAGVLSTDWIETRPAVGRPDDGPSPGADTSEGAGGRTDERPEAPADQHAAAAASPDAPVDRRYGATMAVLFAFYVARAFSEKGVTAFLPTFLVSVYAYSFAVGGVVVPPESFANLYFTAVFLVAAATAVGTGWLVDHRDVDHRTVLLGFFAVATLSLAVLATGQLSPLALLVVLLVLGGSNWGWMPARDALVNDVLPPEREGRTFGYLYTSSHVASAVAPVVIGLVAGRSGFRQSFAFVAVTMVVLLATVGALYSPRVYRPTEAAGPAPEAGE